MEPRPAGPLDVVRDIPRRDRVFYGVVLAVVGAALVATPIWRAADPNFAAVAEQVTPLGSEWPSAVDPWGETLRALPHGGAYSLGPDRRDDLGGGDDVRLGAASLDLYAGGLADALYSLAALMALLWEGLRAARALLRRPPGPLPVELGRSAALGFVPGLALFLIGTLSLEQIDRVQPGVLDSIREGLVVPLPVALAGSAFGVATLGFLYLRLSKAKAGDPTRDERQAG